MLNIQRDLAPINPDPFLYLQCYTFHKLPDDFVGPIPGAYHIIAGEVAVPLATRQALREAVHQQIWQLSKDQA